MQLSARSVPHLSQLTPCTPLILLHLSALTLACRFNSYSKFQISWQFSTAYVVPNHISKSMPREKYRSTLKECHPRCVYQNYNGLIIINSGSQKHNYICKYNNLPTTCFGLIRPSSGWNTASEENHLSDLNAGVQGWGRDLVYKYGVSG